MWMAAESVRDKVGYRPAAGVEENRQRISKMREAAARLFGLPNGKNAVIRDRRQRLTGVDKLHDRKIVYIC